MAKKAEVTKALKTKFPKKANRFLEVIASNLEKDLTDDSTDEDIQAAVDGSEDLVNNLQSFYDTEVDRRVTTSLAKHGINSEKPEEKPEVTPAVPAKKGDEKPDDVPAWAQTMMKGFETLNQEITNLKSGSAKKDRKTLLEDSIKDTDEKFKAMTLKAFNRMSFENDEACEEYLDDVRADAADFVTPKNEQEDQNGGRKRLGGITPPISGQQHRTKTVSNDTKAYIESVKQRQNEEAGKVESNAIVGKSVSFGD